MIVTLCLLIVTIFHNVTLYLASTKERQIVWSVQTHKFYLLVEMSKLPHKQLNTGLIKDAIEFLIKPH